MPRAHFRISRPEHLEGRALLSTMMVESEPNNRAVRADVVTLDPVDHSAVVIGTTHADDRDYFVVPIMTTGSMTVTFQFRGKAQAALKVSDAASGQSLFEGLVRAGTRSGTLDVTAGEKLIVRVADLGRNSGAYSLKLTEAVPQVMTTPTRQGSPSTSPAITEQVGFDSNGHAIVAGTLADASAVDSWKLIAPKSGRLTIIPAKSSSPVVVQIVNPSGQVQFTFYTNLPNFTASTNVIAGGNYVVRVRPQAATPALYHVGLSLS